jgi:hypothetical protein
MKTLFATEYLEHFRFGSNTPKWKSWLKRSLLPRGEVPRKIPAGLLRGLTVQIDFAHGTQRWLGLQERELFRCFRKLSRGIGSAIDVGANDGMYTLYFLRKTSAQRVLAFEPDREILSQLRTNLALNSLSSDSRLEIIPDYVGASKSVGRTNLDSFLPWVVPPCLVKVDIEGGEGELLRGAQELLSLSGVRWIIEVHSRRLEAECLGLLHAAHYLTVVVPNAWWRVFLPELRPAGLNRWIVAVGSDEVRRL